MNNYILINRTYCETTPDSLEYSDFSDHGFISEQEQVTFSELVSLMVEHYQPSQSPNNGNIHVWYSTQFYTVDYSTGTERQESIHYCNENTGNIVKYWKYATIAAKRILKNRFNIS